MKPGAPVNARELESLVTRLHSAHERWLDALTSHESAVRRADPAAMELAAGAGRAAMSEIAALEQERRAFVEGAIARGWRGPVTIGAMAASLDEPSRSRLEAAARSLRRAIVGVQRRAEVLGGAVHAMLGHVDGLMRQVARRLSHAGTYGRRGMVEASSGVAAAVDVRL